VRGSARIEARDGDMAGAIDGGEPSGDDDFSVRLRAQRLDGVVGAGAGVERGVQHSVEIQPGDAVSAGSLVMSEYSANHNFAVRLDGNADRVGVEAGVSPAAERERGVDAAPLCGRQANGERQSPTECGSEQSVHGG